MRVEAVQHFVDIINIMFFAAAKSSDKRSRHFIHSSVHRRDVRNI